MFLDVTVAMVRKARLVSHAGSLTNLVKHLSSTVRILGAKKALFRVFSCCP